MSRQIKKKILFKIASGFLLYTKMPLTSEKIKQIMGRIV